MRRRKSATASQSASQSVESTSRQSVSQAEEGRVIDRGCVEGKARKGGRRGGFRKVGEGDGIRASIIHAACLTRTR